MNWFFWSVALSATSTVSSTPAAAQDRTPVSAPKTFFPEPSALLEETPGQPIGPGAYESVATDSNDDSVPLPNKATYTATAQGDVLVAPASGDPFFLGFAGGSYYPPAG